MKKINEIGLLSAGVLVATTFLSLPAAAQQASALDDVAVNINVVPFATLEFEDPDPLLHLEVPPPGSTVPATGVGFTVIGNSSATLSAQPESFMQATSVSYKGVTAPYLGRATQGGEEIGFDLQLELFTPVNSINGLPLIQDGPAVSPQMDVEGAGGAIGGVLHLIANPNWTAGGALALPGLYEGEIVLTLTAS